MMATVWFLEASPTFASIQQFYFTFENTTDTISGSGMLYATPNGDGSYKVISSDSVTLTIEDMGIFPNGDPDQANDVRVNLSLSLLPANATGLTEAKAGSAGYYTFDNLIFPDESIFLDPAGIVFATDGTPRIGLSYLSNEPMIQGAPPPPFGEDSYYYYYYDPATPSTIYYDPVSFSLTAVPEPSTIIVWLLLGLAVAGYGIWRRR